VCVLFEALGFGGKGLDSLSIDDLLKLSDIEAFITVQHLPAAWSWMHGSSGSPDQ